MERQKRKIKETPESVRARWTVFSSRNHSNTYWRRGTSRFDATQPATVTQDKRTIFEFAWQAARTLFVVAVFGLLLLMTSRLLCTSNNTCQLIIYRSNGRVDLNDGQVARSFVRSFVRSFSSEAKRCAMNDERRETSGQRCAIEPWETLGNLIVDNRSIFESFVLHLTSRSHLRDLQLVSNTRRTSRTRFQSLPISVWEIWIWKHGSFQVRVDPLLNIDGGNPRLSRDASIFLFSRAERSTSSVIHDYEQKI